MQMLSKRTTHSAYKYFVLTSRGVSALDKKTLVMYACHFLLFQRAEWSTNQSLVHVVCEPHLVYRRYRSVMEKGLRSLRRGPMDPFAAVAVVVVVQMIVGRRW